MTSRFYAAVFLLTLVPCAGWAQGDRDARIAQIRDAVNANVADLQKRISSSDPTPSTRDLPDGALAALVISKDVPTAQLFLQTEFAQQNMDPNSPDYGELPWRIGHPEIKDENAIEFGMQAVGPILAGYGNLLPAQFRQELLPHLRAAIAALKRHNVKVSYTNIYLMNLESMILVGEAIGDQAAAAEGYDHLNQWINLTRQSGIHEFDSPTYYAPDLSSLAMGYHYAASPVARAKFKALLDYIWLDICANYFRPRGSLSGPHSRDYDFLNGTGDLDVYMFEEGLQPALKVKEANLQRAMLLDAAAIYRPPMRSLAVAGIPEKLVTQRWDPGVDGCRYNYITPDFAIGSASGDYDAQDKLFSVELGGAKLMPVISVVPDVSDQPYGIQKIKGRDGHSKPVHIPLHLVSAQQKGTVLLLLDLDPGKSKHIQSLATNIILPSGADEIVLDGKGISANANLSVPANVGALLGVRQGYAGVAIRVFLADGCAGNAPAILLKSDPHGLSHGAIRLAIYHYRGGAVTLSDRHARVGLLVCAAHCGDEAAFHALLDQTSHADIEQQGDGKTWSVRASIAGRTLEAARSLEPRRTLYRRVNGMEFSTPPLSVNGANVSLQ